MHSAVNCDLVQGEVDCVVEDTHLLLVAQTNVQADKCIELVVEEILVRGRGFVQVVEGLLG